MATLIQGQVIRTVLAQPQAIKTQLGATQGPSGPSGSSIPLGKTISYDGDGKVDLIEYENGEFKQFFYIGDLVDYIEWHRAGGVVITSQFTYAGDRLVDIVVTGI